MGHFKFLLQIPPMINSILRHEPALEASASMFSMLILRAAVCFQMLEKPLWFKSLIACELFFQVPFFAIASIAFVLRKEWIQIPCIIYSAQALTAIIPIFASLLIPAMQGPVDYDLSYLLSVNSIFAALPLMIGFRWLFGGRPFWGETRYAFRQNRSSWKED